MIKIRAITSKLRTCSKSFR